MTHEAPKAPSILDDAEMKKFIEMRGIKPEDFHFIDELAKLGKDIFVLEFHNFFTFAKEESAKRLTAELVRHQNLLADYKEQRHSAKTDSDRRRLDSEIKLTQMKITMYSIYLELTNKYGYIAVNHLNRKLEDSDLLKNSMQLIYSN